jgi:hypothetical protein
LIHGLGYIGLGVERLEEFLALLLAPPVDELHVLFLDRGAVHEHYCAQVAGCRRAEDIALKSVPDQTGDPARVIDVGVGKNQAVDVLALAGIAAVSLEGFLAFALKHATVEHDGFAVNFDQVLRTGHGTGGAIEGNFHAVPLFIEILRASVEWSIGSTVWENSSGFRPLLLPCWYPVSYLTLLFSRADNCIKGISSMLACLIIVVTLLVDFW